MSTRSGERSHPAVLPEEGALTGRASVVVLVVAEPNDLAPVVDARRAAVVAPILAVRAIHSKIAHLPSLPEERAKASTSVAPPDDLPLVVDCDRLAVLPARQGAEVGDHPACLGSRGAPGDGGNDACEDEEPDNEQRKAAHVSPLQRPTLRRHGGQSISACAEARCSELPMRQIVLNCSNGWRQALQ
jgi:hypothetical protein